MSLVTPSYNQAQFLEETIRSVLLQGYPDLEYVVIDGGSGDGSVDIIREYEAYLTHWSSAPDRGQSHAINAGFTRCTGEVWAWLASDDVYMPGTLARVAEILGRGRRARLVYGSAVFVDAQGKTLGPYPGKPLAPGWRRMQYWRGWDVPQPTLFFDRSLFDEQGALDEALHYSMDYEWLIRVADDAALVCLPETLALYRMHADSKTGDWVSRKGRFFAEMKRVNRRHAPPWWPRWWPLWWSWLAYSAGEHARQARAWAAGRLQGRTGTGLSR